MRSERWMTPGTYSRPAEPMPFTRPNLAPLALTHSGPFGPSMTWGMRSLRDAEALRVKRSGGSQIRSTWPSAEMTSYFIGALLQVMIIPPPGPSCQPLLALSDTSALRPPRLASRDSIGGRGVFDRGEPVRRLRMMEMGRANNA